MCKKGIVIPLAGRKEARKNCRKAFLKDFLCVHAVHYTRAMYLGKWEIRSHVQTQGAAHFSVLIYFSSINIFTLIATL